MSEEELTFLQSPEGIALVEAHLDQDPVEFVLSMQKSQRNASSIPVSSLATQIKYLQRARTKLPSWFHARCILPPRAFEQASSELAAELKPVGKGARALDLSCGLGVDTRHLSRHYTHVTAVEQNPQLAAITAWNLARLGCENVDLRNASAEDFLRDYQGPPFDLVYLDPDRRDTAGQRRFALADCRPDVLELRGQLHRIAQRIMVKLSPMLDLSELKRQLDPLDRITVVAVDHECKEILVEFGAGEDFRMAVSFARGQQTWHFETEAAEVNLPIGNPEVGGYAYEPDISLYKAGITGNWWSQAYPDLAGGANHPEGYFFSPERLENFPGRAFQVEAIWDYKPSRVKKALGEAGHSRINYSRRWFDLPLKKVVQQIGVKEGGEGYLLLTQTHERDRIAILARRM